MISTDDHSLPAFDARNNPRKLALEVANYPKLANRGQPERSVHQKASK